MAWTVITMFVYRAFSGPPLTTWHCSSTLLLYYIEYAENNRQYPVIFTNDDVMVFDSVVWKNSYLCGDGDKSVDTYQKKRYALLLAET